MLFLFFGSPRTSTLTNTAFAEIGSSRTLTSTNTAFAEIGSPRTSTPTITAFAERVCYCSRKVIVPSAASIASTIASDSSL